MTDATKPRRYFGSDDPRVILPSNGTVVPDAVRKASDELAEMHERVAAADREAHAALAELDQAKAIDVSADREASIAGKTLPTKRATPQAEAAFAAAERKCRGERAALDDASVRLAKAIAEAFADWHPRQVEAIEQAKTDARTSLHATFDAIDRAQAEREILRGLEITRDSGSLRGVTFGTSAQVAKRRAKALERQRELVQLGGTGALTVDRDLDQLLAALLVAIEGHLR
jgi:hypothetical protein